MPRLRFSTSTLAGEEFVPWLASAGELSYCPHSPPERDYYFQYSWVIPGILSSGTRARRRCWSPVRGPIAGLVFSVGGSVVEYPAISNKQNKSASGIARKSWEGIEAGNGGLLGSGLVHRLSKLNACPRR
jgi:hypothetical protein